MDSLLDPLRLRPDRTQSPSFMPREDDYAELLRSSDFDVRLQTLNRLAGIARRDPDWFTNCARKGELFKNIDRILADDRWEVQHQCIKFLQNSMETFGSNLEYCMCYLMPNLIPKLGSSKITVRKISVQAIQAFLRYKPEALGSVLKTLSNFLLTSTERATKMEALREFPAMFLPELANCDWSTLLDALTKLMATSESDYAENAAVVGKKLEVYLGKNIFTRILDELSANQRKDYARFSKGVVVSPTELAPSAQPVPINRSSMKLVSGERRLRFGIVPSVVAAMVMDNTDATTRISGLEKLKQLIENITSEEISRLVPHLHSYLISLSNVLNELNFKVVVIALDVVRLTVNRLKTHMEAHLQQVVTILSRHFGNQKAVVKQLIMMTCMDLFQNINPKAVVGALCVYLENKNSRIREEVVNILTSALMITSSSRINFTAVLNMLVPLLLDPKRRVRLAAFEQLSVVGYLMSGKVDALLRMVKEAEERHGVQGLSSAVMARLRRQTLPRIRYDGLIEYSTPPVNESFGVPESELGDDENLDLHWILHAGESTNNRPISPISMVAGMTKGFLAYKPQKVTTPLVNGKCDAKCAVSIDRMKSDDQILRKSIDISYHYGVMGSAVTRASSAKVRSVRPIGFDIGRTRNSFDSQIIAKTNLNSNLSACSLQTPSCNSSLPTEKPKSASAVAHRTDQRQAETTIVPIDETSNENLKKNELNNNHLPAAKPTPSPPANLARAKSENNLSEELENNPPINFDDVPIKPAKGGQFFDEVSHSTGGYGFLTKKSTSHYSLPVTTTHAPLKNSKSGPTRRQAGVVKSTTSALSTPAFKSGVNKTPLTQIRGGSAGPKTVANALKKIDSDDWSQKVDGINLITELSATNPKDVAHHMHEVVVAILNECKNLRSSVCRVALVCAGTLTQNMKGKMDQELDKLCMILINKAGDVSNAFIREDASEALEKVVKNASAGKALQAIIAAGSKSKNNTVRTSCASFVGTLVSRLGVAAVLSSTDQLAKLIPQLIAFSRDPNPHVRMHGRQTLRNLSEDSNFDRQVKKSVSESEYRSVKAILEEIDKKGGLDSLDSTCTSISSGLSRSGSVRKTLQRKLPDNVQLDLDEIRADLTAASWERRLGGLKRFEEMCTSATKAVSSDTKLIEAFIGRLNDINSKVSLEGLDTYLVTLPALNKFYSTESHLKAVLNQLVLALMSHLSSKSDDHRNTAQKCLIETIKRIDPGCLSPAIAAATRKANVKQKPFMLGVFNRLNSSLFPTKPKQVELMALPVLWECLKAGVAESEIRKAVTAFAKGLVELMGERSVLEHSSMEVDPSKRKLLESLIR